jgi:four helix bundle protein
MRDIRRFEDLKVWQDALEFSHDIYRHSSRGKFSRDFALRDQIRRAAISVLSNVAEGFESRTDRLFLDFLGRAKASAGEVRAQLYLAAREQYVDESTFHVLVAEASSISRQLAGLMKYLNECSPPRHPSRSHHSRNQ